MPQIPQPQQQRPAGFARSTPPLQPGPPPAAAAAAAAPAAPAAAVPRATSNGWGAGYGAGQHAASDPGSQDSESEDTEEDDAGHHQRRPPAQASACLDGHMQSARKRAIYCHMYRPSTVRHQHTYNNIHLLNASDLPRDGVPVALVQSALLAPVDACSL